MHRAKKSISNIIKILRMIAKQTPELIILIVIITVLNAILPFINIISTQRIVDEFIIERNARQILLIIAFTIIANASVLLLIAFLLKMKIKASTKFELLFQRDFCFHQMNFSLKEIESTKVKELQRNMEQSKMRNGGIDSVIIDFETVTRNILNLVVSFLLFMRIFTMQEKTNVPFWTSSIPLLLLLIIAIVLTALTFRLQIKQNIKISDLNQQANEANGNAFLYMQFVSNHHFGKDIRIYGLRSFLCDFFGGLWKSSIGYRLSKKLGFEKAKIPCITSFCNGILDILIYFLAIMKAFAKEITAGSAFLYIGSIQVFTQSIAGLVNSAGEMLGHGELVEAYIKLLDMQEEEQGRRKSFFSPEIKEISFHNVYFRYTDTSEWVLANVSFTIKRGMKVALVGENGSGKSTIIKLLCRLYTPERGKIELDGIDIRDYDIVEYRKKIGVVFQDFALLSFKLGENVASSEVYSLNRVKDILSKVGLDDWMNKQFDSLNKYLYKDYDGNGIEISGGEAQKISIARCLYKETELVVLDEPTAALDPRAEVAIYNNFDNIIGGKTVLYVSHRLSSCRFCHNILVLLNGKLIESGTHEELLVQNGKYKELWTTQAELYHINE